MFEARFLEKKSFKAIVAPSGKSKMPKKRSETRCGCNAHIYVKLVQNNRYYISSMVEQHNLV